MRGRRILKTHSTFHDEESFMWNKINFIGTAPNRQDNKPNETMNVKIVYVFQMEYFKREFNEESKPTGRFTKSNVTKKWNLNYRYWMVGH